jgi:hypothetical protein
VTTRILSIRRLALGGVLALPLLSFVGCGESRPPAPPAPGKVIEKQLDSKDPKDRLEGAKQAEKLYGSDDASDKASAPAANGANK